MTAHVTTTYRFAPIPEDLLCDPDLSGTDIRVYGVLMRHGLDPASCYPSVARIAEMCNASESTVRRSISALETAGWVEVFGRAKDDGSQTSNAYRLHTTPCHQRQAPPVIDDSPPLSPVTDERESLNESHRTKTLAVPETQESLLPSIPPGESKKEAREAKLNDEFEAWYSKFPSKRSKGAARKAYRRARAKVGQDVLLTARDAYAALIRAQGVQSQYVKHPSSWLNQECWDDDYDNETTGPSFSGPEMRYG